MNHNNLPHSFPIPPYNGDSSMQTFSYLISQHLSQSSHQIQEIKSEIQKVICKQTEEIEHQSQVINTLQDTLDSFIKLLENQQEELIFQQENWQKLIGSLSIFPQMQLEVKQQFTNSQTAIANDISNIHSQLKTILNTNQQGMVILAQRQQDLQIQTSEILKLNQTSKWGWGSLTVVVVSFSILTLTLNYLTFQFLPPQWIESYLQGIFKRVNWSNIKLERIEKHLGSNPKNR